MQHSVLAKRLCWIDAHNSRSRDRAGDGRDCEQEDGRAGEGEWINGRNTEQQTAGEFLRSPRAT